MPKYILSYVLSAFIRWEAVSRFEMFYFTVVALTIVVVSFQVFYFFFLFNVYLCNLKYFDFNVELLSLDLSFEFSDVLRKLPRKHLKYLD